MALESLDAFSMQVEGRIAAGVITAEEGQPLLDAADDLRSTLTTVGEANQATDLAFEEEELFEGIYALLL